MTWQVHSDGLCLTMDGCRPRCRLPSCIADLSEHAERTKDKGTHLWATVKDLLLMSAPLSPCYARYEQSDAYIQGESHFLFPFPLS
jgi:hypothetical protein